jgi:hypothetical protein
MPRKQKKYHFIYKTTCSITGKYYVGMHSSDNLDDGYLGSGKILGYSRHKYGDENHTREILEYAESREQLRSREKVIVNEELLSDPLNINLKYSGEGGWDQVNKNLSKEQKSKRGRTGGDATSLKNKSNFSCYESHCKSISDGLKKFNKREKITFGCAADEKIRLEMVNRAKTEESILKRKKTMKERKHSQGKNNSQFGIRRIGIHKDGKIRKVKFTEINKFLEEGWLRGFK